MHTEQIVYVDPAGHPTGQGDKLASHHAETPLHLAFSCYLFNSSGQFLITRRADSKKVWPGVWTNSVCGHPAPGEAMADAIIRRLDFELGMQLDPATIKCVLPNYRYTTPPYRGIIENEFCPVYIARTTSGPTPNPTEVGDWRWISWADYIRETKADTTDRYSWWCKDQLRGLEACADLLAYTQ